MKKRLLSLLLAGAMVFALAACNNNDNPSGGNTDPTDNPGTTVENAQGVTDTEVLVANTAAVSGAYASVGLPFLAAIEAYFEMVNSEGGIDGRKITFLHEDDEFDPQKGRAYLQQMVEDEKVFAIVGHFGTPVVSATLDDLKSYGIPSVYFATGIGQLFAENATTNEEGYNIFPIQPLYITEGQVMVARGVGNFDAKKIGVIYTNDDAGMNMLEGAEAKAAELGVELVSAQVTPGATDVSAAVTSIKGEGVDFVIVAAIQATMPTIVKEMANQNMTVPAITTYVCAAVSITEQIAADIAGKFDVYASSWKIRDEDHADDVAAFTEWMPEEYVENTDAESGWVAAHVFCEGLRRLEGEAVTWESYMAALEEAPIEIPFGGSIDFSNGQRMGVQSMLLSKCNPDVEGGWEVVYPMEDMATIVANAQ
ncbi:MAG TPA: ABC transporter substrate-binding protein [Candidatus Galloscillospira stercoripullorum]|nr:ABC transporter substrate-binding protein [Candidatus Galloscillospira stercoripullorum]